MENQFECECCGEDTTGEGFAVKMQGREPGQLVDATVCHTCHEECFVDGIVALVDEDELQY